MRDREREREREREAETQAEGEAGSLQGARCRTRSQDPGVTPWAEGRCSTAEPPRHPYISCSDAQPLPHVYKFDSVTDYKANSVFHLWDP